MRQQSRSAQFSQGAVSSPSKRDWRSRSLHLHWDIPQSPTTTQPWPLGCSKLGPLQLASPVHLPSIAPPQSSHSPSSCTITGDHHNTTQDGPRQVQGKRGSGTCNSLEGKAGILFGIQGTQRFLSSVYIGHGQPFPPTHRLPSACICTVTDRTTLSVTSSLSQSLNLKQKP